MIGLKKIARFALDTRVWIPSHAVLLRRHAARRRPVSRASNQEHILAAVDWIRRAQDATGNDGVAGRYLLDRGWTEAYPETSGYIIPTLLDVADRFGDDDCRARCRRIIDFLYSVQMDVGGFPGGEYNPAYQLRPSVFNTGQIVIGLLSWYQATQQKEALESAARAVRWLNEVQESDGAWERFTYGTIKTSYHSRVAWPLAAYGKLTGDEDSTRAATGFVEWVLSNGNPRTGWVSRMDFNDENHRAERSITHTLAYTYRGLLECGLILDRSDIVDFVNTAAENIAAIVDEREFLSGFLDHNWKNVENFVCLTGNCQLATILLKLYRIKGNDQFLRVAEKLLDFVKGYQVIRGANSGIRGGVSGSAPIWGGYIRFGYPNWAAKFLIDALMLLDKTSDREYADDTTRRT